MRREKEGREKEKKRNRTKTSATSAGDVDTSRNRAIPCYLSPSRAIRGSEKVLERKEDEKRKRKKRYLLERVVVSPREPSLFVEGLKLFDGLNWRPVPGRSEISSKATDGGVGDSQGFVETVVQEVDKGRLDFNVS